MVITSKSNPLIKEISKLYEKKHRKEKGLYLVEGIKPVNECIVAGCVIENIVCTESLADKYNNAVIVSTKVFETISSEKTPQGVLAIVKKPQNNLKPPQDSCILLDCLQDIYLINCTDPYAPKAVRASMSGIFFVNIYQGTSEEVLNILSGVKLVCADMNGENIFEFSVPGKFCLCIGNEGNGISQDLINNADYKIKIPMDKSCESLNAAVSAGIAMYQLKYNKR